MAYNPKSPIAAEFIDHDEIMRTLELAHKAASDPVRVRAIIAKGRDYKGLTHEEASILTFVTDPNLLTEILETASTVKEHIYGKRIVMFAPLYLSDYCVNECTYCGYHATNKMPRKRLTQEEVIKEIEVLQRMGHKRLALEMGEDNNHAPIEYILECIKTIYEKKFDNGSIRRVNINIAATTVEEYKMLKAAGIGTYILFQETYHQPSYTKYHKGGPKAKYDWHTTAHDRAMQAGIDDVGLGVLYGLYDWHYEVVAQIMHAEHLEAAYGVGPHTLSVPRIRKVHGISNEYEHAVNDEDFKKIVAILRLTVPYTGMILSTREGGDLRKEIMRLGISQISAGSMTGVGGYSGSHQQPQFEVEDHRSPLEATKDLMCDGYIPSFCTACYRNGRTGDRFMELAKSGEIGAICAPNALMTLKEYSIDYGDKEFQEMAETVIAKSSAAMDSPKIRELTSKYIKRIENGERDLEL